MRLVAKQKPLKKREYYRKTASEIRGKGKAAFFNTKSDMRDFCRVVRQMGLEYRSRKDKGWLVWVD